MAKKNSYSEVTWVFWVWKWSHWSHKKRKKSIIFFYFICEVREFLRFNVWNLLCFFFHIEKDTGTSTHAMYKNNTNFKLKWTSFLHYEKKSTLDNWPSISVASGNSGGEGAVFQNVLMWFFPTVITTKHNFWCSAKCCYLYLRASEARHGSTNFGVLC